MISILVFSEISLSFIGYLFNEKIFSKSNKNIDNCFLMRIYMEFVISILGVTINFIKSFNYKDKDKELVDNFLNNTIKEVISIDSIFNGISNKISSEHRNNFTEQLRYLIIKRSDDIDKRESLLGMSNIIARGVFGGKSNNIDKKFRIANIISIENIKDILNDYSMELNENGVTTIARLYIGYENDILMDILK